MRITKLGHCCLIVEVQGQKFLSDPGMFTRESHEKVTGLDAILITHEHADHFHTESLQTILTLNPTARVLCNTGVGAILAVAGVPHEVLNDGEKTAVGGVNIAAYGSLHQPIHSSLPPMENTGFLIAEELWYPGDAYYHLTAKPRAVALPMGGPWMKFAEAIDYALLLKPKLCFPVHDAVLTDMMRIMGEQRGAAILAKNDIEFVVPEIGKSYEI